MAQERIYGVTLIGKDTIKKPINFFITGGPVFIYTKGYLKPDGYVNRKRFGYLGFFAGFGKRLTPSTTLMASGSSYWRFGDFYDVYDVEAFKSGQTFGFGLMHDLHYFNRLFWKKSPKFTSISFVASEGLAFSNFEFVKGGSRSIDKFVLAKISFGVSLQWHITKRFKMFVGPQFSISRSEKRYNRSFVPAASFLYMF